MTVPPYGYKRSPSNRLKLIPDENTADVVRMIFDLYADNKSLNAITQLLNDTGIKRPNGGEWDRATVKYILRNPVYIGSIVWGKKSTISVIENGVRQKKRIKATPIVVPDTHEAIVSRETFEIVQRKFANSVHAAPVNREYKLTNPLAGLLYCAQCGKPMLSHGWRGKDKRELLIICPTRGCPTRSAYLSVIMAQLLDVLPDWSATYKPVTASPARGKQGKAMRQKEEQILSQIQKAQELVEIGVYTPSEYLQRKKVLENQLLSVRQASGDSSQKVNRLKIPEIKRTIEAINYTENAEEQNRLLKTIIARIDYSKIGRSANKAQSAQLIKLVIYPKIGGSI